jgi:hypothetical protein
MDYDIAIEWLAAWRRRSACLAIMGAIGGFGFSVVLLILAWAFVFMVSLYILGGWIPHDVGWWHAVIAMIAIPLLFIGNACVSRETLGQYSFTTGTATNNLVIVPGVGSNVNPIAPNSVISMFKMMCDVLFCGPRVMVWSFREIGHMFRLLAMDVPSCAAVLAVLHGAGHRVSYQDIAASIDGLNPVKVFPQLRLLQDVLFLESDPPGLSLGTRLREKLSRRE